MAPVLHKYEVDPDATVPGPLINTIHENFSTTITMSLARDALIRRQNSAPPTPEEIAFDKSSQLLAITGTFFTLAALIVILRCYVRISMLRVFGTDDYTMVLAMVSEPARLFDTISTYKLSA